MDVSSYRPPEGLRGVLSGVGAVDERLAGELKAQGVQRPLIVCGANIAASPLVAKVRQAAGMACALYAGSRPHTPIGSIDEGARVAADCDADAVIALGGSSASDCAKGIIVLHRTDKQSVRDLDPLDFSRILDASNTAASTPTALICIPTTLSAAEFQSFFGALDERTSRKSPYGALGLIARTVFLDGAVAAATPATLWAETGVKALDDALSRYCNSHHDEPAADAVLEAAICGLIAHLGPSMSESAEARQSVLVDTWLSTFEMPRHRQRTRGPWFSTAARHVLGGLLDVPHGVGSCVALAESLRFHGAATTSRQQRLASLAGFRATGEAALAAPLMQWMVDLGVPTSLSALGHDAGVADEMATAILHESPGLGSWGQVRAAVAGLW